MFKKKKRQYLVSYQAQKEGISAVGDIEISFSSGYFEKFSDIKETKKVIFEKLGEEGRGIGWSIVILNIIKFPIK
jgi:hypothetical protein